MKLSLPSIAFFAMLVFLIGCSEDEVPEVTIDGKWLLIEEFWGFNYSADLLQTSWGPYSNCNDTVSFMRIFNFDGSSREVFICYPDTSDTSSTWSLLNNQLIVSTWQQPTDPLVIPKKIPYQNFIRIKDLGATLLITDESLLELDSFLTIVDTTWVTVDSNGTIIDTTTVILDSVWTILDTILIERRYQRLE